MTTKGITLKPDTPQKEQALTLMRKLIEGGRRVIFGSHEPMTIGIPIGQAGDKSVVVVRRATREEFLANAPGEWVSLPPTAPFYWEAGLSNED